MSCINQKIKNKNKLDLSWWYIMPRSQLIKLEKSFWALIFIITSKLHAISCLMSDNNQQDKTTEQHRSCLNMLKCTHSLLTKKKKKNLLTSQQTWGGQDAFHSYSNKTTATTDTTRRPTQTRWTQTDNSLHKAAKGQGLQYCLLVHFTYTLGELCNWAGMRKSGEPLLGLQDRNYSSTQLWGEAKNKACGLVWVSPEQVIQYFHSVCMCKGGGRGGCLCWSICIMQHVPLLYVNVPFFHLRYFWYNKINNKLQYECILALLCKLTWWDETNKCRNT